VDLNILVTAAGSIVGQGVIKCLRLANMQQKTADNYKIIAGDMSVQAAGIYRANLGIILPPVTSPEYLDFIIKTCISLKIKAIFIGSDEELLPLTLAKNEIENKSGAVVITNPLNTVLKAVDKWKTFEFLRQNNLPCSDSALPEDQDRFVKEHGFPLVVKPREGHGSLHFYLVHDLEELQTAINSIKKVGWRPLLQEYLDNGNAEFTTGITISKNGKIMSSIAMRKILKNGQTYKAFIDNYKVVRKSAEEIALAAGGRGPLNIQAKMADGKPKVFEINARFSATSPLRAVAGINEPDIVFRNVILCENINIEKYEKLVCMRYLNEVYVPYSTYEQVEHDKIAQQVDSFIPNYF
jgi:carbamoyl-phosphate synthase large subunit